MPQIPMTIQASKLEKDLAERGCAEVGKHLSGANFPVLVHGVHNSAGIASKGSRSKQVQ